MGDGISILTNVSKVGSVSKIAQSQQGSAAAQDKLAKHLQAPQDEESTLLKDVDKNERLRLQEDREEERRRRKRREAEAKGKKDQGKPGERGSRIDLKV